MMKKFEKHIVMKNLEDYFNISFKDNDVNENDNRMLNIKFGLRVVPDVNNLHKQESAYEFTEKLCCLVDEFT